MHMHTHDKYSYIYTQYTFLERSITLPLKRMKSFHWWQHGRNWRTLYQAPKSTLCVILCKRVISPKQKVGLQCHTLVDERTWGCRVKTQSSHYSGTGNPEDQRCNMGRIGEKITLSFPGLCHPWSQPTTDWKYLGEIVPKHAQTSLPAIIPWI